jgi:hypothetical protein
MHNPDRDLLSRQVLSQQLASHVDSSLAHAVAILRGRQDNTLEGLQAKHFLLLCATCVAGPNEGTLYAGTLYLLHRTPRQRYCPVLLQLHI